MCGALVSPPAATCRNCQRFRSDSHEYFFLPAPHEFDEHAHVTYDGIEGEPTFSPVGAQHANRRLATRDHDIEST